MEFQIDNKLKDLREALETKNFEQLAAQLSQIPVDSELKRLAEEEKELLGRDDNFLQWMDSAVKLSLASLDKEEAQNFCISLARLIAELVKLDENRSSFGSSNVYLVLIQILTRLDPEKDVLLNQILRCMGNLCFDHDSNRDVLAESEGGVLKILQCISSSNQTLITTSLAVLLNLTMENSVSQNIILENQGMESLLGLLKHYIQNSQSTSHSYIITILRILCNLLESETATAKFNLCNGLFLARQIIQTYSSHLEAESDVFNDSLKLLEAVGSLLEMVIEDESTQRDIIMDGVLHELTKTVDQIYALSFEKLDANSTDSMEQDEPVDGQFQLKSSLLKMYCGLVILSTLNDFCMPELARNGDLVNTFKRWVALESQETLKEIELRIAGALCLGNLSRSDDSCFHLVKDMDVGTLLINSLVEETDKLEALDPAYSMKLIQALTGALKNLSLSGQTRDLLGPHIFDVVVRLAENYNSKQIQFTCIGIIRNLVSGLSDKNAYRLLMSSEPPEDLVLSQVSVDSHLQEKPTYVGRVNRIIWNATGENDAGIRNEGGRISVNILRTLQRHDAPHLAKILLRNGSITLIVQIVTGALLTQPQGDELDHHLPLDDRLAFFDAPIGFEQVFPIVQNEGLVSLALICALCPEAIPRIANYQKHLIHSFKPLLAVEKKGQSSFLSPAAALDDLDSITRVNVCQIVLILSQQSDEFRSKAKAELFTHLEGLSKKTLVSLLATPSESRYGIDGRLGSGLLTPFPKDEANLRMNGRRLSFQDTLKYRKELEINVQQQGGLQKALSMQGSRTLEQTVNQIMDLFKK